MMMCCSQQRLTLEGVHKESDDLKAPEAENMELAVKSDHSDSSKPIGVSSNEVALTREQEIERQLCKVTESMKASWDCLAIITVIMTE